MMNGQTEERKPNLSPEQQETYDIFVSQGTLLASAASQKIKGVGADTPGIVGTIGDAMVDIVNKVETEGEKRGLVFDDAAKVHGSAEILTNFLNMSGINLDEEQTKRVVGHMVGRYLKGALQSGRISKDKLIQMGSQLQQKVDESKGKGMQNG